MTASGLTDQTLADKVGVSRVFITRIRNGTRQPSLDVAAKLLDEFPTLTIGDLLAKAA